LVLSQIFPQRASNISLIVETKVDSDEDGCWNQSYQTERIVRGVKALNYLKPEKYFLFITYGTSEYYTKPYKNGPASPDFRHIKLDNMVSFVESALNLPLSNLTQYKEWVSLMKVEQEKRSQFINLLRLFSAFRQRYLEIHKDIDFPNNRLTVCAPEFAFPLLYGLAEFWNNNSSFCSRFGRVSVYPVSRQSPHVQDSILNFWEMWQSRTHKIGENRFYFEINEDFNLNFKLEETERLDDNLRDEVWQRLNAVKLPSGIEGRCRSYKQTTFVLYEWDFGLLETLDNYSIACERLCSILENTINALA
jgi:hypothetical protein